MAVSTRSEVAFWHHTLSSGGRDERAVRPGGTHGVVEINGGFVAPMGRSGLLLMGPKRANTQTVSVLKPSDGPLNLYRVVTLESPDLGEVVACASRRDGFIAIPLGEGSGPGFGRKLRAAGTDFVDVARLGVDGFPFAVAALGIDCSIHLSRNLLGPDRVKTLRFDNLVGRGYRILCAEGHVFLLTDRGSYSFVDLARRFLSDEPIKGRTTANYLDLEGVDVSLSVDRAMLENAATLVSMHI